MCSSSQQQLQGLDTALPQSSTYSNPQIQSSCRLISTPAPLPHAALRYSAQCHGCKETAHHHTDGHEARHIRTGRKWCPHPGNAQTFIAVIATKSMPSNGNLHACTLRVGGLHIGRARHRCTYKHRPHFIVAVLHAYFSVASQISGRGVDAARFACQRRGLPKKSCSVVLAFTRD